LLAFGLTACGQQAQPEQTVVSTAAESLTLSTATAERLAGHYVRDGVRISFDSIRTAATFKFVIKANDGRAIIRGEKTAEQKFTTSVLDSRLNIFYDLAATENNVSYEGDQTAMDEAQQLPEYQALPWMSHALGEHGYNGRDYPAALAMHMFNKG